MMLCKKDTEDIEITYSSPANLIKRSHTNDEGTSDNENKQFNLTSYWNFGPKNVANAKWITQWIKKLFY